MQITLDVPEDIAAELTNADRDLSRAALEALALEGYRSGVLSQGQVRRLLGYQTRPEVDGFLKRHGVPLEYTEADLQRNREAHRRLGL